MNTPERWSTASSDSDLSSIFGSEGRWEGLRAKDVLDLLQQRIAFFYGGRDRRGGPIITFPARSRAAEIEPCSLARVLTYLASLPSDHERELGFSLVLDMRGSTWPSVKPMLKALQECFIAKIHTVYLLKPDGFWERSRVSFGSSKLLFETALTSLDGLAKFIDIDQLTLDLGGTFKYDHSKWINMRMALEKFLYEASSLLAKLEEIQDGLDKEDFSDTLEGLKDQIKHNQHVKKWIIKAPVELLQEEGEKIRNTIKNPSYEDSEDSLTEDDVKKAELQIQELVEGLHTKRQKLRELWNLRKMRLDQCFQYRVFQQDAEKMLVWIRENHQEFLLNYAEIGNDTTSADELQEEHRNFQGSCMVSQVLGSKLRNSDIISKQFSCIYVQNKSVRIFESCVSRACLFVVVISVQTI
ncbi:hypothetical protein pdam_00005281 [Pocillopora damicornis]|uniref:CRAL-TRIO domain-containing protein n=1 Tax=Pocillopora damicornis TaxID=46731 RepID=A0A3M6TSE6_POCDA|nr:hypothetical protein pdam_00005281 [Pocillopora damicornis]